MYHVWQSKLYVWNIVSVQSTAFEESVQSTTSVQSIAFEGGRLIN